MKGSERMKRKSFKQASLTALSVIAVTALAFTFNNPGVALGEESLLDNESLILAEAEEIPDYSDDAAENVDSLPLDESSETEVVTEEYAGTTSDEALTNDNEDTVDTSEIAVDDSEEVCSLVPLADSKTGWNIDDQGHWLWYSDSHVPASGWQRIGGIWYYFDPSTHVMKEDEAFQVGGVTYVASASGACPASSWVRAGGKWYLTDGSCAARSGWAKSGGSWYYLDPATRAMREGEVFQAGGVTYVASASGACPVSSWVRAGGKWYLTDGSCSARSGWAMSGGRWYYLDPATRAMREGEAFQAGGKTYVADSSGACPASSWVRASGKWYLTDGSCAARSGWAKVSGKWYYFDPASCVMKESEAFEVDGMTYTASSSGACVTGGWVLIDGAWFYNEGFGSISKGWKQISGVWYYFDINTGRMKMDELFKVDGSIYVARSDGSCPSNAWVAIEGKWYRTNSSCAVRTGWWDTGVTYYYFDPSANGASVTGSKTIGGKNYYFHKPMGGLAIQEYVSLENGERAYVNGEGIIGGEGPVANVPTGKGGWISFDGDWYYIDEETGEPKHGWVEYKGNKYWLDSEGVMVTGAQLIDGTAYWFTTTGELKKELNGDVDDLLSVAKADVGYNVESDPQRGSKYGRWYQENANPYKSSVDYGANGVAYCVMAVTYWLNQANVGAPGFPRAGCESTAMYARMEGRTVAPNELERGMLVLFDWDRDGEPDHIGIVDARINDRTIKTVEGNTSSGTSGSQGDGGWVAQRTRDIDEVFCGIRPYYM